MARKLSWETWHGFDRDLVRNSIVYCSSDPRVPRLVRGYSDSSWDIAFRRLPIALISDGACKSPSTTHTRWRIELVSTPIQYSGMDRRCMLAFYVGDDSASEVDEAPASRVRQNRPLLLVGPIGDDPAANSCGETWVQVVVGGWPILNFAFFAKFRVGMLEANPNLQPAVRDAGDRVGINNTKTRKSARRLCPAKELPHSGQSQA